MSIEVVPCLHPGAVDLRSSNHLPGDEVLHASAAEWAEFIAAVKDGRFDDVAQPPEGNLGSGVSAGWGQVVAGGEQ
jgi:hypothetical protein